jgi:hypothetical protein
VLSFESIMKFDTLAMPSRNVPVAFTLAVVCFSAEHSDPATRDISAKSSHSAYSADSADSSRGALVPRDVPVGLYRRRLRERGKNWDDDDDIGF